MTAQMKHPQILFGSDLRRGETVLLGADGWVRDPRLARVAHDAGSAAALEQRGKSAIGENRIVEIYLADVEVDASGAPTPLHYREKMRLAGPSVRPDIFSRRG